MIMLLEAIVIMLWWLAMLAVLFVWFTTLSVIADLLFSNKDKWID